MSNWESFHYGTQCAWITPDKIQAPSMQRNRQMTAQVMNGAFKFYYNAWQASKNISGSGRSPEAIKAVNDLKWKIQKDLLSAADFWVGSDLKFVFQDLVKNKGYWKDDEWNGWKGNCNVPQGVFAFYAEIEKRGREVSAQVAQINSYSQYRKYQGDLKRIKDAGQWDKLAKELDYSGKVLELTTPKVWALLGGSDKTGANLGGLLGKWYGYAGSVHGYLSLFNKVSNSTQGTARTALAEAAAMVVERLPVFGPLYADVVRGIPGLMTWFENYGRQVDRATRLQFQ
jgi:hypothetical protein